MQYRYTQYENLKDAKTKVALGVNFFVDIYINIHRGHKDMPLLTQLERFRQAVEYIELQPPTNEKYRLVEARAIATGVSMLSAANEIYTNEEEFFDYKWPAIEEVRERYLELVNNAEEPSPIQDVSVLRYECKEELSNLFVL